jgi:predicted transposase/invertase (TIGR01784 family)
MEQRILWYTTKLLSEQPVKKQKYHTIKKAISIVITDYPLCPKDEGYHNVFRFLNDVSMRNFGDILEVHTLELPKVAMNDNITRSPREQKLIQWLRFFKAKTQEEYMTLTKGYPLLYKAFELVAQASGNENKRKQYQQRERDWMDYQLRMSSAYSEGEQQEREKWQTVVAEKEAENEKLRKQLSELRST